MTSIWFPLTISPLNHTSVISENKGNDNQLKKLLIVRQILLVRTLVNVQRPVWRIFILMLGSKVSKAILNYLGYAVPCYVICLENSRYFLHQSYSKLRPIANCSLAFSRALTSLPIFTSSSLWLLVIISLLWLAIVIALALVLRKLLYLSISRTRCGIPINYAFFSFFHRNKWTPLPRELRTWWCGGRPIDLESRSTVPARYTWKQERIC